MITNFLHKLRSFAALAVVCCMVFAALFGSTSLVFYAQNTKPLSPSGGTSAAWPQAPTLESECVILMDADTGAILYEKNSHDKCYPASTTKILTGLLTIENCSMDEIVTFSREAAESVKYGDASLGTRTGEEYTVEQALYGLLLHSANEIAYGLAEHISGSLNAFVQLMNNRAKEMGAVNTHFSNASGLHSPNHYTTAYDMAMIARSCYNNTTFVNIDSTYTTYTIPPTNKTTTARYVRHRHAMLKNRTYYYEYCKGGKTGYTDAAGNTLVTFAEKNGMRLICVCYKTSEDGRYKDTKALFDWGFSDFSKVTASAGDISSIFTDTNYLNSRLHNRFDYILQINTSTITVPDNVNIGDISIDLNKMLGTDYKNGIYTANLNYKYQEHSVGTAKLTLSSKDSLVAASNLPYDFKEAVAAPAPKKVPRVNILWVILFGLAVFGILYALSELKRIQRQRRKLRHRMYRNGA